MRLYNLTFIHAMEIKKLIGKTKHLTTRKMHGQYYHALIVHAAQQMRIVSLSSVNAENEERSFNFLKTVSASSSNHHPENVLTNAFIRLQVIILHIFFSENFFESIPVLKMTNDPQF